MASKRTVAALLAGLAILVGSARALEIPLEVRERAAVERNGNHVDSGFPLPPGAVRDAGQLGLFRRDMLTLSENPAPACFVVRERYPADDSARWVTVHFLAYLDAGARATYVVKNAKGGELPYPIKAQASGDRVTVDTGTLKFTVAKSNFNIIDQAWFDPTGEGKYKDPVVEPAAARLKLNVQSGKYKVVNQRAVQDVVEEPADVTAKVQSLALEENYPGRAVVKVVGQFLSGITPTLDFVARIYAQARSPSIRVSLTVINRSSKQWDHFCGINELSLTVPVKLGGADLNYTFSSAEGPDVKGPLAPAETAWLLQPISEDYLLGGAARGEGKSRSAATRRMGWVDLVGPKFGVAAGVRYFWQMHPRGLAVGGDGSITIQLVPRQDKRFDPPGGAVSEAVRRIDLFAGAARTHEFMLAFHAADQPGGPRIMGIVDPLFAVAPPAWYCQDTQAEGPLWDANLENFKPDYRELVEAFNERAAESLKAVLAHRDGADQGIEEYGCLNFGDAIENRGPMFVAPNDALNSHWDGNAEDFPRAVLVQFWRTGELEAFDVARAAALHLADIDIAHADPTNPRQGGIERSSPNVGHFRLWSPGTPFGAAPHLAAAKCQSLYDLYHLTGDAWFLDCATLVSNYAMQGAGHALNAVANRAMALLMAYRQTDNPARKREFLDEDIGWLVRSISARSAQGRAWDQSWMYGLAGEALANLYAATGDRQWAQAAINCCDSLLKNYGQTDTIGGPPIQGFTVNCLGYAYEYTGDEKYLRQGVAMLRRAAGQTASRARAFAQQFRLSPYFLNCLTNDYKPKPVSDQPSEKCGEQPPEPAPVPVGPPIILD